MTDDPALYTVEFVVCNERQVHIYVKRTHVKRKTVKKRKTKSDIRVHDHRVLQQYKINKK
jgi:hypothetical protein